jgi:acyl-CoA thioesterase
MLVETEVDSTFERVRITNQGRVVDELKRANATRVVREVCVFGSDVEKRERQVRIRKWRSKGEEEFAQTEDCLVCQI